MRSDTGQPVYLKDYRPPAHLIERVELDIALHPTETRISSRLLIRPNPDPAAPGGALVLDGEDLDLLAVSLNDIRLDKKAYTVGAKTLTVAAVPSGSFNLTVDTRIDPESNTRLMGLYRTNGTFCTQCEAEGFRRITYFADRPDVLSVYTVRIEAERAMAPVLLSNGNRVETGLSDGGRHFAVWHDPHPKPAYLFALVGGDLSMVSDRFKTASRREVDLNIFVEPGKEDRCAYAMDALKRSMRWDEDVYGREYDLDVFNLVAVSDFNMGAMENKGLNIFNDKYVLARPDTATDQDYANIEAIIAHEYFHNWTGNRITCRDWFQLCLKEGLTVFRDQEFSADMRSRAVKRIQDARTLRAQQFPEDAGPLAHPVRPHKYLEINNFYTSTVYEKGAEIIRMLKTLIGDGAYHAGMDLYFERHDGKATTIEAFLACFAEVSGADLEPFSAWYDQAGTPEVSVTEHYSNDDQTLTLRFRQTTPTTPGQTEKRPVPIPIRIGLVNPDGSDAPLHTDHELVDQDTIVLAADSESIVFRDLPSRPVPSLFRGFSAPVRVNHLPETADRIHLARHDSDPFNRWQAVQDLANTALIAATLALRAGGAPAFGHQLTETLGSILASPVLDPAFCALLLTLPSEADIAREIRHDIDPSAIHRAREALRTTIADALADGLLKAYRTHEDDVGKTFSPDARSAGGRALRLAILDLMAAGSGPEARDHAFGHFEHADNMTDSIGALAVLSRGGSSDRVRAALDTFYRRHREDPLVVDKWFMVQAVAPGDETLGAVRDLMRHDAFSLATPNRVRALIGSFALANPLQFNQPSGAGYEFLAEIVLELDAKNPQVAARLLSAFRSWQALEPARRAKAQSALHAVRDHKGLSNDVRDIVERTLSTN